VQANGSLEFSGLDADTSTGENKIRLASIEAINVADIALSENGDLAVSGLAVTGAVFARNVEEQGGSVLSAGAIEIDSIRISAGNQVVIGTMEWRDTVSVVRREQDGVWRPVRIVNTLPFANREAAKSAPAAEQPAGRVSVELITVTGDSAMVLIDETVKPVFNTRIDFTEARLQDIDNTRPEQHSPISLKGRIGKHSRIDVAGTMQPFAPEPGVDLALQLEGIALTQLSPYMVDAMGYVLKSGHLDADSTLKLDSGQLDANNTLTIRALELTPAGNESGKSLDAIIAVPLNTALDMLRDRHNTIVLELPVSGDMDQPDFDISDVINTAVGAAVKQGSLTYLTMALQPYGSLITVARLAGEHVTRVRLKPVTFGPGSAVHMEESYGYLEKVAGILKDRPGVNVKICGLAVDEDRPEMGLKPASKDREDPQGEQKLLTLAKQRAAAVKDYLVEERSVNASRLVACQPHIDEDNEAVPRVDLLI
jgi:outer membrane protein OmpA-like peptidoglycan-associated protein